MENLYYGRGRDEDNAKLLKFIDEVFFSDDPDTDFLTLLPKIYKDKYRPAYNNFVVQEENGDFRAAIGCFLNDMDVGGQKIKTCCIGNVAVGREHRSKGYMIDLMKLSLDELEKDGCDLVYLGGQRQRYGYFGFESSGVEYEFGVSSQTVKHALKADAVELEVRELNEDDTALLYEINKLYSKNVVRAIRKNDELFDILHSWRETPYVVLDNGSFAGYFVLGRDKKSVFELNVTEPKYYYGLTKAMVEASDNGNVELIIPPFDKAGLEYFNSIAEWIRINGCESILIFNFAKVMRAYLLAKASYSILADGEIKVLVHGARGDEKIKITVKDNNIAVESFDGKADCEMTNNEAIRAFFSLYNSEREKLPSNIQQWLPLPNYMSSLDTM